MYKCGQIVLNFITKNPSVIIDIKYLRRKFLVMDLVTYKKHLMNLSDIEPWDPDDRNGPGGVPVPQFSESQIDSLKALLKQNISFSDPNKIRYRNREELDVLQKVMQLHETVSKKRCLLELVANRLKEEI